MNYLSLDSAIIYIFLVATLGLGLWVGRGTKTLREYAIADKMYGVGVLTMTILATYVTASKGMGYVGYVFEDGLWPLLSIPLCEIIINFLFIIRYIVPNIARFEGCLTAAEVMGCLYGSKARMGIATLGVIYSLGMVTSQIIWLGYISDLLNFPSEICLLVGGMFLVFYASKGGMKSVAITDVLQFLVMVAFVPVVVNIMLYKTGGITELLLKVPSSSINILRHPHASDYFVYCLWGLFPAFPLSFPFIQRMLMAKSAKQLTQSYYVSMVFLVVFFLVLTLVALAAVVLKAGGDPNIPEQGSRVFIHIVRNYVPAGIKGLIGAGFIAGVMSTADSFLHAAGLLVVHDIAEPLCHRWQIKMDPLRWVKLATLALGLIAVVTAFNYSVLPRIQYGGVDLGRGINMMTDFVALIFTIPLISGLMGLKANGTQFFVASACTTVSFILSKLYLNHDLLIPVNIAVNVISFFGAHFFQNNGFVTIERTK